MIKLPKVAIIYDIGSASILSIKAASYGICDVVFLYNLDCKAKDISQLQMLKDNFDSINISQLNDDEVEQILRKSKIEGILTFSEYQLETASKYCERLGLIGHSLDTVLALTDKFIQRETLSENNVSSIRYAILEKDCIEKTAEYIKFPAILKPRVGAGSKWTTKVSSVEDIKNALAEGPSDLEYVLEEFLVGDCLFADKFYGDYVSVESIHQNGKSKQVCITAKLPLTEHFAESGMFVPHPFSTNLAESILEIESKAMKAMGIKEGITHTEIKLTANGPQIIEINGRLGGYVPQIIKRAMGLDLIKIALVLSLGKEANINTKPLSSVVFQIFITAPCTSRTTLVGIEGIDELENIEGVSHVQITKNIGDIIDFRDGTESNMSIVYGEAPSIELFPDMVNKIRNLIIPKYEY